MRMNVISVLRCPAARPGFSRRGVHPCMCVWEREHEVDQMTASKSNHYDVPQEKNITGFHCIFFPLFKMKTTSPSVDRPFDETGVMKGRPNFEVNRCMYGYSGLRVCNKWFAPGSESEKSAWLHPFATCAKVTQWWWHHRGWCNPRIPDLPSCLFSE